MNTRHFIYSALIAGLVIGLFGNLPVLNLINCFLCLWVWAGGFLAVFLYRKFQKGGPGLTNGQGAGLGAAAGVIGALIGTVVFAATSALSMPLMERLMSSLEIEGDLPFQSGGPGGILAPALFFLIVDIVLYPIIGAISGLISSGLLWKNKQPTIEPEA